MNLSIPPPKHISLELPSIRMPINIPFVGCVGASGTSYIGEQFGNLPDIATMLHIRALRKALLEQIYALIQGQLPDFTRPPVYLARALQIIAEVAGMVATINAVISGALAEVNALQSFIGQKIGEMNGALAELQSIPNEALSEVQSMMMERYAIYLGELNAQLGRLGSTLGCLVGL